MRILIIKLGALGDVLRTTFIARGLKEKYTHCTIVWLTKENALSILKNNPYIDEVITWNNHEQLREKEWDWVIQLDDEEEVCAFAATIPTKRRQGAYVNKEGTRTYTEDIAPWFGMGLLRPEEQGGKKEADRLKAVNRKTFQEIYAAMFGIENCTSKKPILHLAKQEEQQTKMFKQQQHGILQNSIIIGINTGAGERWPLKMIDEKKTAKIINTLAKIPNTTILIFGGVDETDRNHRIKEQCNAKNVINVQPVESIRDFATMVNAADIMICADSLALHIALALNKQTIAFFGPTSPWEIEMFDCGPRIYKETSCLCCYKKTMFHPNCIDPIEPDDIINPAHGMIKKINEGKNNDNRKNTNRQL